MIIEIKGVQFINKGAELMLHAVLQQVEQRWPQAQVALEPNPNSPYASRARLGALQKLSLRKNILDLNELSYWVPQKVRTWLLRKWGIVTEADVDVVLDASGFAYGDQWGSLKIRHLAGELQRAYKHDKSYIFLPQALGPFTREEDRKRLSTSLPLARLICARESSSLDNVKGLIGESDNLVQFADFTNLVEGVVPEYFTDGSSKVLIVPNSNMISERNQHTRWQEHYVRVLTDAVSAVRELGLTPVLLNHEGKGDGEICNAVRAKAGQGMELITEPDPLKVKGIIGASKAVICSRFHGCVGALSQGVPCLGTSWSHKYERLFEEYGRSEFLLQPEIDESDLKQKLQSCISSASDEDYQSAIQAFKSQSQSLWTCIQQRL